MSYTAKLEAAIAWLGSHYVLHPDRRIKRGDYQPQEIHRADVALTFARVRERMAPEKRLIIQEAA